MAYIETQSGGVQKIRKLAHTQRITRSRAAGSSNTLAIGPIQLETHQEPPAASPTLTNLPPIRERKRAYISENKRPAKRLCEGRQSASESPQLLSIENLAKHNSFETSRQSHNMDPGTSERGARKRPLSRQSSIADMSQETASVQSQKSYTAARYRLFALSKVKIFIRPGPLPEEIRPRVNAVVQRTVSQERKRELSRIANDLCNEFVNVLEGASREDDCVEPIHAALSAVDSGKKFSFPRKAGTVTPSRSIVYMVILTLS
jgi:hypothetical protein